MVIHFKFTFCLAFLLSLTFASLFTWPSCTRLTFLLAFLPLPYLLLSLLVLALLSFWPSCPLLTFPLAFLPCVLASLALALPSP